MNIGTELSTLSMGHSIKIFSGPPLVHIFPLQEVTSPPNTTNEHDLAFLQKIWILERLSELNQASELNPLALQELMVWLQKAQANPDAEQPQLKMDPTTATKVVYRWRG